MSTEEHEVFRREVSVRIAEGDGRTLISRLVPYNEVAIVDDGAGPYKERFLPGAFKAQLKAANRIKAFLNFRHRQSAADQIGHAQSIFDQADGLHGQLRVFKTDAGDMALEAYDAGLLTKLSIEFESRRHRIVDGVVERLDARLLGVALVPEGAYTGAGVIAVREEVASPDDDPAVKHVEQPLDGDLAHRMATLGLKLPDAYKAKTKETSDQTD